MKIKLFLALLLSSLFFTSLTACNTVEGFGKDVKKVGGEIEEASEEEQND